MTFLNKRLEISGALVSHQTIFLDLTLVTTIFIYLLIKRHSTTNFLVSFCFYIQFFVIRKNIPMNWRRNNIRTKSGPEVLSQQKFFLFRKCILVKINRFMINMFCYIHWFLQKVYYAMLKNEVTLSKNPKWLIWSVSVLLWPFNFDLELCTVYKNNEILNPTFTFFFNVSAFNSKKHLPISHKNWFNLLFLKFFYVAFSNNNIKTHL